MESLFFHPKLVHLPIGLALVMPLVFSGLVFSFARAWLPARSFAMAAALQATLVVSGVIAIQSGEADEERVESIVGEERIEEHEHAAKRFVAVASLVLALAAAATFAGERKRVLAAAALATVGSLAVVGLAYQTGSAGGDLVYRHGAASAFVSGPSAPSVPGDDD